MQFQLTVLQATATTVAAWRVPVPTRPYWRLYWNRHGGAWVADAQRRIGLTPKRVVLIPPQTPYRVGQTGPVDHLFVHFLLAPALFAARPGLIHLPAGAHQKRLPALWQQLSRSAPDRRRLVLGLAELVGALLRTVPEYTWQAPIADERLAAVLQAMEENLEQPWTNDRFAAQACMAPTAFIRRFKQVVGQSPQAYYLQRRLNRACLALEYSDEPIEAIAAQCGFCDRNYFSTVFKKHYSLSPARFRTAGRQEPRSPLPDD